MLSKPEPLEVLIVDDDSQLLRTLSDILRLRGYQPVTAGSGDESLRRVRELGHAPLIALVDLRLPDRDGVDVIHDLRALSDRTEFVVLTGNASVDSAVRALREQSFDYLLKPVRPEDLFHTLEKATERRQRKDAEAALRASEERLRRLFNAVADGLVVSDARGVILSANPAACEIAGVPLDDLIQRPLDGLLRAEQRLERTLDGDIYRVARADGSARLVEARTTPFAAGGCVHILRDVTEQRTLEQQLRQAQKLDAIGRLAGGVAHDFNNILTAVLGSAEMLLLDSQDEVTRGYGEEIRDAAQRAAALTKQLLAFSRQQVTKPVRIELHASIENLRGMLRRLLPVNIELRTSVEDEPPAVCADPVQLEQIVMNLVVNARDAIADGGTIDIRVAAVELRPRGLRPAPEARPGRYALLSVSDTGSGIPAALHNRIFEPFFTTKELGQGTGLGLATVFSIVHQLGGFVTLESAEAAGTTFYVYLPAAGEDCAEPA